MMTMRVGLGLLLCVALACAVQVPHKKLEPEGLEKELDDPRLADLFNSASEKLRGLTETENLEEIRKTFTGLVKAMKKQVAASFQTVRAAMWKEGNETDTAPPRVEDGNSSRLAEQARPPATDHIRMFDNEFRQWIPKVKKDLSLTTMLLNRVATDMGTQVRDLARSATQELHRIPVHYGRLRRQLVHAFSREDHQDHAELHKTRVIQSECGKPYTLEQFMEIFDHDHNLALTEEPNWTDDFKDEFYTGWPVFANELRLHDPACGSRRWSLAPEDPALAEKKAARKKAEFKKLRQRQPEL